ncbi:hypothetical protein GMST_08140 [Geomonas silvestris]|uniref:Uncharacterized protein n=1 Tax=Geomonas silvestris TaxID=2740184 RepID=A0A6V8MFN8_9BACT|nr:hypothetical protein [Geomonas silvestris]GFO58489.1 hypothetical protein GMST_08140 [Geomonas silvestris]
MKHQLEKLPSWLMLAIGLLLVAGLGVLDYLTGDYSLLIFYAIPVALEAWFLGRAGTAAISLASGLARLTSDYLSYTGSRFSYWNSLQDTAFLLMMGLFIAWVRQLLREEGPAPEQRHKER